VDRKATVISNAVWLLVTVLLSSAALITLMVLTRGVKSGHSNKLMTAGFVLSIASVIAATLIPEASPKGQRLLLNPTDGMDELQAPGNVVLFIPLGGFLRVAGISRPKTMLLAMAFSIAIEMVQFFLIQGRSASTGDVILNTTGALVGHVIAGHSQSTRQP
jgi:glycopeptide antibiotics resistance protein